MQGCMYDANMNPQIKENRDELYTHVYRHSSE